MENPPETVDELIGYLSEPLRPPLINPNLYQKPYHSKTDDLIKTILNKYKPSGGSRGLEAFTLLDSTVIIPPVDDFFKLAFYQEAYVYGEYVDLYTHTNPKISTKRVR